MELLLLTWVGAIYEAFQTTELLTRWFCRLNHGVILVLKVDTYDTILMISFFQVQSNISDSLAKWWIHEFYVLCLQPVVTLPLVIDTLSLCNSHIPT